MPDGPPDGPPDTAPDRTTAGDAPWLTGWRPAAVVGLLLLVRIVAVVVLLHSGVEDEHSILGGDARRYEQIAAGEGTPYEDFEVEYPPVSLGLVRLVIGPTTWDTIARLAVSQLAVELAVTAVLAWAWGRRTAVVYYALGTLMAGFPFPWVRIDFLSVLGAVAGLALLRRGRELAGGATLAVAVFAKLWPFVLAPAMLVERRRRGLVAWTVTGLVGTVAWVGWAGPAGLGQIATFRGARGWQIESLPGIVVHMVDPGASSVQQGAWRTALEVPAWVRLALTAAALATVALAWWWADGRRREGAGRVVVDGYAPLASVGALLVFSTIISPQYVLWLVPFAAVVIARGDRTVAWLTAAIATLSTYGLATIHGQIEGEPYATLAVVVRNGLLVALLVVTLGRLAGRLADPTVRRRPRGGPAVLTATASS
jgi:hypothetical protein